jgi:hypothetical protein
MPKQFPPNSYFGRTMNQTKSIAAYNKAMKGIDTRTMDPKMKWVLRQTGFLK